MNKKFFVDKKKSISKTRQIDESTGFMHVKIKTANDKVYQYAGREISDALNPNKMYDVKKPKEELEKSLDSYADKPINFGSHLDGDGQFHVDKTEKEHQAGYIKSAEYKDGYVIADAVIIDKNVIDYLNKNKDVQVSPAYTASFSIKSEEEINHEDIEINSLTILDSEEARGGATCKVLDSKYKGNNMNLEEQLKEAKEKNKFLTDSNKVLVDSKESMLKDKIALESEVVKLKEELKSATDSKAKLEAELTKTQNQAKANELKIFADSLGKLDCDISKAESIIEIKKIILTDAKFLNKDYSKEDDSSVNAYYDCYQNSKKQEVKTSTDSSVNNINNQLNSTLPQNNLNMLTREQAMKIHRQNNGG